MFALAVVIGAFDIGSYAWLRAKNADFFEARLARLFSYPPGEAISWNDSTPAALKGWWRTERLGTWSVEPEASLLTRLPPELVGELELRALVAGFVDPSMLPARHVEVVVNRTPVGRWTLDTSTPVECIARVPRWLIAADRAVRIDFRFEILSSPASVGARAYYPTLGMRLIEWRLVAVPSTDPVVSLCRKPR